jgi:hypothetical protein
MVAINSFQITQSYFPSAGRGSASARFTRGGNRLIAECGMRKRESRRQQRRKQFLLPSALQIRIPQSHLLLLFNLRIFL